MAYIVYLPPTAGKAAAWLKGTIFTADEPSARRFVSEADASDALAKAAKFHLARTIRACRIMPVGDV